MPFDTHTNTAPSECALCGKPLQAADDICGACETAMGAEALPEDPVFAGRRHRYILGYGVYFAVCTSLFKILDVYWDTGELVVTARVAFTFGTWFAGGGVIGYVAWRSRSRC